MMRLRVYLAIGLAGTALQSSPAWGQDKSLSPEARQSLRFVQGLRERGYHDLALEYLEQLRKAKDAPADLKEIIDYEIGRGTLEEATQTGNLERRAELLDKARVQLDQFAREHSKHPLAPEALVQLARLYVERGYTAILKANESDSPADAKAKIAEARAAFAQAREAYSKAEVHLQAAVSAYPKFIPDGDPRRGDRERALTALIDDQLQRAIVDYEEAQTYPMGSEQRNTLLDKGVAAFELLYKNYRMQPAGLHARMLQGKCFEEKGELGPAMGIYNELMGHGDPRLQGLQRQVGYFRIIVDRKRKEYALAVDDAARWLQDNPRQRVSKEGLGVQLELARNLLEQLPEMKEAEREEATRKAVDRLTEVVRYFSPYKPEALVLLKKYKKSVATLNQIASLSYDDAMSQADSAISTKEWDRAINLLKQAVRRADPAKDPKKANDARYFMAYCYYQGQKYYEAAAIVDHMARRYPKGDRSVKATEIGMAAYTYAYNTFTSVDRKSDLDHLVELAKYTAATWPETEQADSGWFTLGEVAMGRGEYAAAAKDFEAVREGSPRRLDARVKAGDAHYRQSQQLREAGKTAEADAQVKAALDLTAAALKARRDTGTAEGDPAYITNANALAELHRALGKPGEAVALLAPIAKNLVGSNPSAEQMPLYAGLLSILLRSHLANGQPNEAIADMKILESVSTSKAALTQLYFELGLSLRKEIDALEAKRDRIRIDQTKNAYKQFLQTLASSQAGQTYDSLEWAGEQLLALGLPTEAGAVFEKVQKSFGNDPRIVRTNIKNVGALRGQKKFEEAKKILDELIAKNPRSLDFLLERGYLYEDWAKTERSAERWTTSLNYWNRLGTTLEKGRPRRPEYFESMFHVAVAMEGLGRKSDAAKTLRSIMTLSPTVGNAELRSKYQTLLARLG